MKARRPATPAPETALEIEPAPVQTHSNPPSHHELGFALPSPTRLTKIRLLALALGAFALLGGAFTWGYLPKLRARQALAESSAAAERAALRVEVVTPTVGISDRALALPASVSPLEETTIYSRANGYVQKWLVDIGDKVEEGQLLAEISTPELDQELAQAKAEVVSAEATVTQAKANRDYSHTNLERYQLLAPTGVASQQELEQKRAQAAVDVANVDVAIAAVGGKQANIRRLLQLKGFAKVVAPYAGTITSRTIERGALVTAATGMFKIAIVDPVRVFVDVPQDVAPSVRANTAAKVTVAEYPGRVFEGAVTRTAGALAPASRTLKTEVRVPNHGGELLTGMYAEVELSLPSPHRAYELPATAVMTDAHGVRVAVVTADHHVRLVPIVIERDTGATVRVSTGINEHDTVVKIASANLADGMVVEEAR